MNIVWLSWSKSDIIFLSNFIILCVYASWKKGGWFALFGYEWNETNLELPVHTNNESKVNACYFLGKKRERAKKRDSFKSFNIVNGLSRWILKHDFPHSHSTWLTTNELLFIFFYEKGHNWVNEKNENFMLHIRVFE